MYYTDQDWDIWEGLQDDEVRLVFSVTEGPTKSGKSLPKKFVDKIWGPLEAYPPKP